MRCAARITPLIAAPLRVPNLSQNSGSLAGLGSWWRRRPGPRRGHATRHSAPDRNRSARHGAEARDRFGFEAASAVRTVGLTPLGRPRGDESRASAPVGHRGEGKPRVGIDASEAHRLVMKAECRQDKVGCRVVTIGGATSRRFCIDRANARSGNGSSGVLQVVRSGSEVAAVVSSRSAWRSGSRPAGVSPVEGHLSAFGERGREWTKEVPNAEDQTTVPG